MKFNQRLVALVLGVTCLATINVFLFAVTKDSLKVKNRNVTTDLDDIQVFHIRQELAHRNNDDGDEEWKALKDLEWTLDLIKGHIAVLKEELKSSRKNNSHDIVNGSQLLLESLENDQDLWRGKHVYRVQRLADILRGRVSGTTSTSSTSSSAKPTPEKYKSDNFLLVANITRDELLELEAIVNVSLKKNIKIKEDIVLEPLYSDEELWPWQAFHNNIRQHELYSESDSAVDQLLYDLAHQPIAKLYNMKELGTQIKVKFRLDNGGKALFKPMRFSKDTEANTNHQNFEDFERHHAEIAAFHLDRVLSFHRVPPVSGRYINLTRDIEQRASKELRDTFFISPSKNVCFHAVCDLYCDSAHAVCGHPHMVEGSMATWLPSQISRDNMENPWAQTYSREDEAEWKDDEEYCDTIRSQHPYNEGRRLLDIMDLSIFDFLTGNMDRHHYHYFDEFGNFTFILHLDNGKGFGRPRHDEAGLLGAVTQCCLVRASTLKKLLTFHTGPEKLSTAMQKSLSSDMLSPVLNDLHLQALDRRLAFILETVYKCGKSKDWDQVILHDGF